MGVAVSAPRDGHRIPRLFRPAGFYFPPPSEHFNRDASTSSTPNCGMVTKTAPRFHASPTRTCTRAYVLTILREIAPNTRLMGLPSLQRAPPARGLRAATRRELHRGVRRGSRLLPEDDARWLAPSMPRADRLHARPARCDGTNRKNETYQQAHCDHPPSSLAGLRENHFFGWTCRRGIDSASSTPSSRSPRRPR